MKKTKLSKSVIPKHDLGHRKLRELELVAERLNENLRYANSTDVYLREAYDAYKMIEKIVLSKSLALAAQLFTKYAAAYPHRLAVEIGRMAQTGEDRPFPTLSAPKNEISDALGLLWRSYFHAEGWTRLKCCPICRRWFVDLTSDKRKQRCSEACTNIWWDYERRKKAEYTRFKEGGYHGKKKR